MKKRISQIAVVVIVFFMCITTLSACSSQGRQTIYQTIINQNTVDINDLYTAYLIENPGASFDDFLQSLSLTYTAEYASTQAINSVVSIYSTFTKRTTVRPGQYTESNVVGAGSGVIYKIKGNDVFIITNYHVIYDRDSTTPNNRAKDIQVFTYENEDDSAGISAGFVGGDMTNDIAIIKANKQDFQSNIQEVKIANSDEIRLGQTVIAIGNPIAAGISITSGIISVVSEEITMEALDSVSKTVTMQVIRTDTAINSGNSGSGLFNARGELIGIVNAKTVQSGVENMGYAIPSNMVIQIANGVI